MAGPVCGGEKEDGCRKSCTMGCSDEMTGPGYGEKGGRRRTSNATAPAWREARDQVPEKPKRREEELVVGQWCKLDHDGEMGRVHGISGTLDAECEVRGTVNRTEPWLLSSVFSEE